MRKIITILLLVIPIYLFSQDSDYFDKGKEYEYNAIYIDKYGDTITNEKVVFRPLGRAWIGQPWLQKSIRYVYNTDTAGYKNYIDPNDFFHEKNMKYFAKKGKVRISKKETTGGFYKKHFYMHPPRTNQYRMLFYAPHPFALISKLTDSITTFEWGMNIYLMGDFKWNYTVTPMPKIIIDDKEVIAWRIFTNSTGNIKERFKKEKLYNSTLDAIFTKELGFTKLHYTFENGIKIQFNLEKVVYL